MIVVERTFVVTAAPGAVLSYLQDFGNIQQWDPSAERTSRLGNGPVAPGSHWRHTRKFFGVTAELTYTLLEADPGRLVFHGRSEGATCIDTVTVRPVPGGTEIGYRVDLEMHGLAKLTTPLMKVELEKLATESVAAVTAALAGTATEPAGRRLGPEFTRGGKPQMKPGKPNRLPTPAEETG
jgi:polyketide cyclase/dehydrase/lipid transport protein